MNKTKRSRVQGGWAAPQKEKTRSDKNRAQPAAVPAWISKNIDQVPSSSSRFQYQQPDADDLRQKPADIVFNKGGVFDISEEPSGISRLRFFPSFFDEQESDVYFKELYDEMPWKATISVVDGVTTHYPRLTAWIGDLPYEYAGVTHQPDSTWSPILLKIKSKLEDKTGHSFNSLLGNLYRSEKEDVGWHSDDEPELGQQPLIASLSFGDTRNFELRKKPVPNNGDYTYSQTVRVPLSHGSLIIMEGATQDDWQHRIPKEYHDRGPRINLTFRVIFPKPS